MRKFFDSKFAFIAVLVLFTSAFTWNLVHGAGATVGGSSTGCGRYGLTDKLVELLHELGAAR